MILVHALLAILSLLAARAAAQQPPHAAQLVAQRAQKSAYIGLGSDPRDAKAEEKAIDDGDAEERERQWHPRRHHRRRQFHSRPKSHRGSRHQAAQEPTKSPGSPLCEMNKPDACGTGQTCVRILGSKPRCAPVAADQACWGAVNGTCPLKDDGTPFRCVWASYQDAEILRDDCYQRNVDGVDQLGKFLCTALSLDEYVQALGPNRLCLQQHTEDEARDNLQKTLQEIESHNSNPSDNAIYQANKYAACSDNEFIHTHTGFDPSLAPVSGHQAGLSFAQSSATFATIPKKFDWREQGAVTRVRTQYQCNSCWAHVAAQEIESAWIIAGHKANLMSVEEIFSCLGSQDYAGARPVCSTGGFYDFGFKFATRSKGLAADADMPLKSTTYTSNAPQCPASKPARVGGVPITYGFATDMASTSCGCQCKVKNEENMAVALATKGPLAGAVKAEDLKSYGGGIMSGKTLPCGQNVNHAIQIIGYDMTGPIPYWIVKNTWGSDWGEGGNFRLEMFKNNLGIGNLAMWVEAEEAPCSPACGPWKYCDEQKTCKDQPTDILMGTGSSTSAENFKASNAKTQTQTSKKSHATKRETAPLISFLLAGGALLLGQLL